MRAKVGGAEGQGGAGRRPGSPGGDVLDASRGRRGRRAEPGSHRAAFGRSARTTRTSSTRAGSPSWSVSGARGHSWGPPSVMGGGFSGRVSSRVLANRSRPSDGLVSRTLGSCVGRATEEILDRSQRS